METFSFSLMYFKIYKYNLLLIIRNIGMIDNNFVKYNVINAIIINIPEYFNIVSRMIDNISFSKWNKWWISIIVQNVSDFQLFLSNVYEIKDDFTKDIQNFLKYLHTKIVIRFITFSFVLYYYKSIHIYICLSVIFTNHFKKCRLSHPNLSYKWISLLINIFI